MSNKVTVQIGSDSSGLASGMNRAQSLVKSFAEQSKNSLSGIGAALGVGGGFLGVQGLTNAIKRSVQEASNLEGLTNGLKAVAGAGVDVKARLEEMREVAKLPGLSFAEAVRGDVRLQAVGISAEQSKEILIQFGNALATVGGGGGELRGVVLALGQISAKGKISAEEINQLAERIPQIRTAIKAAFGTSDTELLQGMGISVETFIGKVTKEFAKLPRVVGGTKNTLENLEDTLNTLYATAGKPIAEGLLPSINALSASAAQSGPALESFGKTVGMVASAAVALAPHLQQLVAIYISYKGVAFIQGVIAGQAAAMRQAATAAAAETTALAANTTAQRTNAAARKANAAAAAASAAAQAQPANAPPAGYRSAYQSPYAAKLAAGGGSAAAQQAYLMKQLANTGADATASAAAAAASSAGTKFAASFSAAAKSGLNAYAPAIGAVLTASSSFLDAGKSIGGETGKKIIDGISIIGSLAPAPYGLLLSAVPQTINAAFVLGQTIGARLLLGFSEANLDGAIAEQAKGYAKALDFARAGKGSDAAASLATEIARARDVLNSSSPPERDAALQTLEALYQQEAVLQRIAKAKNDEDARVAAAQKLLADDQSWKKAAGERQQAAAKLREEGEKAAGKELGGERDKLAEQQIELRDPKEQITFWKARVQRELDRAKTEYNVAQGMGGKQYRGEATPAGLSGLIPALAIEGRNEAALKLAKSLGAAAAAQEKLDALTKAQDKSETKDEGSAKRIEQARVEFQLEAQLLAAKARAAGEESKEATALEDQLKTLRLQAQIKEQLGVTDAQALELAQGKVTAENQVNAALLARQQNAAKQAVIANLAVLKARATGNTKEADKLEKEQRVREEAKRIAADTGTDPATARRIAEQKVKLEDQAQRREERKSRSGDGEERVRHTIRGFSSAGRAVGGGDLNDRFRNLHALAAFNRVRPSAAQAAENKAKSDAGKETDPTSFLQQLVTLFTSVDNKFNIAN